MMRIWSSNAKILACSFGLATGYGIGIVACDKRPDFEKLTKENVEYQEMTKKIIKENAEKLKELEEQEQRQSE